MGNLENAVDILCAKQEKLEFNNPLDTLHFYRQVIRHATIATFGITKNYQVLFANNATTEFLQRSICGEDIREVDIDVFAPIASTVMHCLETEQPLSTVYYEHKTAAGKKYYFDIFSNIIYGHGQQKLGAVCYFRDVTDEINTRDFIAHAERLSALGEVSAGIVHEIRNPLQVIKGFVQILSSKPEYQRDKEIFDLIIAETDRTGSIISEFLQYTGSTQPKKELYSLNKILQTVGLLVQSECLKRNIALTVSLSTDLPDVQVDVNQIKQVFLNVLNNSIQALQDNCVEAHIQVFADRKENGIAVVIEDNGPGMPSEVLEKIGSPFFTTKADGTGLGLNISREILKNHGGDLTIESKVNVGTKVKVFIPL